jgi:hypothetical protein
MRCPKCDELYGPEMGFCATDGSPLVPAREHQTSAPPSSAGAAPAPLRSKKKVTEKICPTCGDRFDAAASFCGKDGTSLVPIN